MLADSLSKHRVLKLVVAEIALKNQHTVKKSHLFENHVKKVLIPE